MAPTIQELGIDRLPIADRLALLDEIWNSIAAAPEQLPVTEEQKHTIDRRIAQLEANPKDVLTWDDIKTQVQGKP